MTIQKKAKIFPLVALCAAVLNAPAALAAPITNSFGLTAPASTLTFDEIVFAQGTTITNQYAAYGSEFSPPVGMRYDTQGPASFPGISGHYIGNFSPAINPFSIHFVSAVTGAAFGMATNPGTTTFTALLGGSIMESFSAPTTYNNSGSGFYGFTGITFDEIRINVSSSLALIDNIQTGSAVPEPAILALLGIGLAGIGFGRRQRN